MAKEYVCYRYITTICLALFAAAPHADEQAPDDFDRALMEIEEVLVTARKKSENLQKVPMAIDSFSLGQIEERGLSGIDAIADYSAALSFDVGVLPNDTRPTIRSLTSSRGRGNVAVLVDFVDVSSESLTTAGGGMTANMRLLDLERVEVVKGPQSVLYGRSAFSGAVNFVTRRPSAENESQLDVQFDEHNTQEIKLSASGPLTDTLNARVNIANWETDGWYENPNTNSELGDGRSTGGALALEWLANENLNVYGRVELSEDEYGPRAQVLRSTMSNAFDPSVNVFGTGTVAPQAELLPYRFDAANVEACADPSARATPFYDASFIGFGAACRPQITGKQEAREKEIDSSADPFTGKEFAGTDSSSSRLHLELDWQLSETLNFKWISGYNANETSIEEDFDLTSYELFSDPVGMPPFVPPSTQFGFSSKTDIEHELSQLSQEFRLSGLSGDFSWMVSGLYWEEELDTTWADTWWLREGGDAPTAGAISFLPWIDEAIRNDAPSTLSREAEHLSLAATVTWAITPTVNLTIEGRYIDEQVDYEGSGDSPSANTAFADPICNFTGAPCAPGTNSVDEDAFVPRVIADWAVKDNVMVYASYSEGFKPGGVDTTDAEADITSGEYDSEKLKVFEFGVKSQWPVLKGLTLNGAVYFYEYTDQQVGVQVEAGNFTTTQIVNAGETTIDGFEFDANLRVSEKLSVSLAYVFSDAEYDDFNLSEIATENGFVSSTSANNLALAGNAEADYSGNQTPLSAKHAATMSFRWTDRVTDGITSTTEFFGIYQSKRYIDNGNLAYLPDYSVANLSTALEAERWTVMLYVDNVFDDDKIKSGFLNVDYGFQPDGQSFVNAAQLILPQPRTIGGRISYKF